MIVKTVSLWRVSIRHKYLRILIVEKDGAHAIRDGPLGTLLGPDFNIFKCCLRGIEACSEEQFLLSFPSFYAESDSVNNPYQW